MQTKSKRIASKNFEWLRVSLKTFFPGWRELIRATRLRALRVNFSVSLTVLGLLTRE